MICNSFIVFVLRPTLMYANTLEVPAKNGIKDLILSSKLGNDLNIPTIYIQKKQSMY